MKHLTVIALFLCHYLNAQVFDQHSLNLVIGSTSQHIFTNDAHHYWFREKMTFSVYGVAEKKISPDYQFRVMYGYRQKGGRGKGVAYNSVGEEFNAKVNYLLQNLSLNLGLKIFVSKKSIRPFFSFSAQGDFLFLKPYYKTNIENTELEPAIRNLSNYNRFCLAGQMGFGVQFKEKWYAEFTYIPISTRVFIWNGNYTRDLNFGLSFGYFIGRRSKN